MGLHVLTTGGGAVWVDRWPEPRAVLARTGANFSLAGDPEALNPDDLAARISGMLDAPPAFQLLLREAFPDLEEWPRVILELRGEARGVPPVTGTIRRLGPADAESLARLDAQTRWVSETWGGAKGLALGRLAFGAFLDGRLASVAAPFFVGDRFEDVAVVTEPTFRGRGLSPVCAARVCEDILRRGRVPSWSTSPDNLPSLRVAGKLGFRRVRGDVLYVIGVPVPPAARPPETSPASSPRSPA